MTLASVIRMHLGRLTDFSGREPGRVFWPWVALLLGVATTVGTLALLVFLLVKPSDAAENRWGVPHV